ncbi:hypothetical protein, partial [Stutzerimonas sp.]|uniref:hypothetical protein n=1 Tax=Stutzerimonas sp. TaxID=2901166 RepID=UPI0035AFF309
YCLGFEKTLNLAQQSQISLQVKSNSRINECCFVMLIIYLTISLTFTSTHTNCLIQLLKSVSIKSFVSTEAAHSTAALLPVKLFLKKFFFLLNRLRFRSTCVSRQREANHTAFKTAVNHLFQPPPINPTEAANRIQPPPCQPGAFYSNPPSVKPFYFANLLI